MTDLDQARVVGENGLAGVVLGPSSTAPNEIAIQLDDGREISVPPSAFTLQPDGKWHLQGDPGSFKPAARSGETVIPVLAEELEIGTRKRTTGAVRVQKTDTEHEETVSMPLTQERAQVKRVVINRPVDGPLPVRREGDTIIMPVVEEVAVVEKRLMLKEEIHVTRRRSTERHEESVTLRTERADVRRTDESGADIPAEVERSKAVTSGAHQSGVVPAEDRSILDPSKPRPNVLKSLQKPAAVRRKKI